MKYFLINAFGKDRPGIVAAVSKVLYENGFNLEDSTMSRLGGEFTIMLVVETDKSLTEDELERLFENVKKEFNLNIYVKEIPFEEYKKQQKNKDIYRIVVYGADKPGIVYKVSDLLAKKGINVVDMTTEKSGDLYVLLTEVNLPENLSFDELKQEIDNLKKSMDLDVSCEKIEVVEL